MLEKASIIIYDNSLSKIDSMDVMFNPSDYTVDHNVQAKDHTLQNKTEVPQITSMSNPTLSLDLFFDSYEKQEDVRGYTVKLLKLVEELDDKKNPYVCCFAWGPFQFYGYLTSLKQKFTMFLRTGIPVRATVSISIKRSPEHQSKGDDSDQVEAITVSEDEPLSFLADKKLKSSTDWRALAEANDIDNPRKLKPGTTLTIPKMG